MICQLNDQKRSLVLILLWDWWTVRNKKNAEGKDRSVGETCNLIQRHALDFKQACLEPKTQGGLKPSSWMRPPPNQIKVNFDAAFLAESGEGAWGFVMRSDNGDFLAGAAGKLHHVKDALHAEAEACVAAAEGVVELGLHRVIFESDSLTLVSALQGRHYDLAPIGVLLKEVRSLCIGSLESFTFQFAPRGCNAVAHSLAQYGLRAESECTGWEGSAPDCISAVVASDIAVDSE